MKKIIVILIVLLAAAGAAGYYFLAGKSADSGTQTTETQRAPDAVVARVNGTEITAATLETAKQQLAAAQRIDVATLDDAAKAQLEQRALDVLIGQELVRQAIAAQGIAPTQEDVDAQLESLRSQFDSEDAFTAALTANGTTLDDLRAQITNDLSARLYISQSTDIDSVKATDEEIQAAYENAIRGVENPPTLEDSRAQVEAFVIQQKQQQLVNDLIQKLRDSANVEVLL